MLKKIYKPGQGKYTRLTTGFVAVAIVGIGCWRLYQILEGSIGNLWVAYLVPVIVLVASAVAVFWLLNRASVADFLIAGEGELKKVNWSSRKEVAVSTLVVIIVVVVMAVLLGATDMVFQLIFQQLLG